MLLRRVLLVLSNSLGGAALGYVALLAMGRYMGPELLGGRAFILSLVFIAGLLVELGLPWTHARRLGAGEPVAVSNGTFLFLRVGLLVAFLVLASLAMTVWFGLLGRPATDVTEQALWLALVVVAAKALRGVALNTFRGLNLIRERETAILTNTVLTAGGTVLAAIAYAHGAGRWSPFPAASEAVASWFGVTGPVSFPQALHWLVVAFLVGEAVSLAVAWWLFVRAKIPIGRPDRSVARAYLHATAPLLFLTASGLLMKHMDRLFVGFFGTATELGYYQAAAKLSDILVIVAQSLVVVLLPAVAGLAAAGRMAELRVQMVSAERWLALLLWFPVAWLALDAPALMHIGLSDQFLPAVTPWYLLTAHAFILSLTLPLRTKAVGLQEPQAAAKVAGGALALNFLLNLVLVPDGVGPLPGAGLGALGAAIATLASATAAFVAFRLLAARWTGHPILPSYLVRQGLAAAATVLLLAGIDGLLPARERFYDLVWYGALVGLTYLAILALAGELRRRDVKGLMDALRRGSGEATQTP
ncbi:MAG: oligosaccharide flippase family protein [Thermoplasmatota archaeon]